MRATRILATLTAAISLLFTPILSTGLTIRIGQGFWVHPGMAEYFLDQLNTAPQKTEAKAAMVWTGAPFRISDIRNGWVQIEAHDQPNGTKGWILESKLDNADLVQEFPFSEKRVFWAASEPRGLFCKRVMLAPNSADPLPDWRAEFCERDRMVVLQVDIRWAHIQDDEMPSKFEGWIETKWLSDASMVKPVSQTPDVAVAERQAEQRRKQAAEEEARRRKQAAEEEARRRLAEDNRQVREWAKRSEQVRIGMSLETVEAMLGRPSNIAETTTATTKRVTWSYGPRLMFLFDNGRLVAIHRER